LLFFSRGCHSQTCRRMRSTGACNNLFEKRKIYYVGISIAHFQSADRSRLLLVLICIVGTYTVMENLEEKKNSLHSQKIVVLALNIVCPGLKSVFLEGRMNEVMENFSVWRGCRWTGVARVREEGRGEVEGRSRHNVVQRNSENSQSAK